jgi:peptidyl-prolyl cis-trans isomerase SurA
MRKLILSGLLASAITLPVSAQTLFTFGNTPVTEAEFLKVYKKNSSNKAVDYSEKAIREYIDLYSLFRMKVQEANMMHLDTAASVASELDNYRRQLAKSYLTDDEVTNRLVKEAYDRSKEEVHVAHILILCPATDTIRAYRLIDSLYKVVTTQKADFSALAKEYSEDKGSKNNSGDIGFISALQTVYPFENAVYNTAPGKISAPFRTQFGYHIVKVIEKRPARGEVKVAQILVATQRSKGEEGIKEAHARVDSILAMIKKGVAFDTLVKKYSDDKFSKDKNGELPAFGVGRMVPEFDKAAFGLKKPGDITQQAIQTEYGFHIIKLIEKMPMKPFDSVKTALKRKVDNDSRAQQARDLYFEKVKQNNGFKEYPANYESFAAQLGVISEAGEKVGQFSPDMFKGNSNTLFSLGGHNYTQNDFLSFAGQTTRGSVSGSKPTVFGELYGMYKSKVINDFQEHKLVEENVEFRGLMQEYKDGIMLFELMDRNVWSKATKDSAGLRNYYEGHKDKYKWEPGFKGTVYTFKNEEIMKKGVQMLKSQPAPSAEAVAKALASPAVPDAVNIQQGRYEFSKFNEVPAAKVVKGVSDPVAKGTGFVVVKADEVYTTPSGKMFNDARGYVISNYQDQLEKDWNSQLRAKYPVKVNEETVKKIIK